MSVPHRSGADQWWTAVVCGMASYIDSAAIVGFGIAVVIYQGVFRLTPGDVGLIQGALTFGIASGALVGGRLGDRFGRRPVFTVTMVLVAIGAATLVFSGNAGLLIVGSLLVGLGTGADLPVSLSTISEASDDARRGRLIGFSQQFWLLGIVVAVLLATFFAPLGRVGAQILYGHVLVVAVLVMIARLTVGESLSWLHARDERRQGIRTVRADRARIRILFAKPYLIPFVGLAVFYALINLIANNNGQFSAYLLVNAAGQTPQFASLVGLISLPLGFLFGLWFMAIVDGPWRFRYFLVGAVLTVVGPLIPAVFGFSVPTYIASLVISLPAGAFAGEALMKYWSQRSFPTLVRTTAQGTIIAFARYVAAAVGTVTPLIITAGAGVLYGLLAACAAAGMLVAFLTFRHRDGHTEFDIEAESESEAAAPAVAAG